MQKAQVAANRFVFSLPLFRYLARLLNKIKKALFMG
jgi:hypothetical protein